MGYQSGESPCCRYSVCTQMSAILWLFDSDPSPKAPTRKATNITHCTNLRTVHLHDIYTNPDVLSSPTSPVVQLLSQIASRSVRELIMEFSQSRGINFDWTCLANTLADPKFNQLQIIHVQADLYNTNEDTMCSEWDAWSAAEIAIRQGALSVFDQHGILYFTCFTQINGSMYQISQLL